jgi:hypothetical protein
MLILDFGWWVLDSSYALRDSGVTRWLVKEAEILDFGFWMVD